MTICLAPNCSRTDLAARGLCQMHYSRWKRYGRLDRMPPAEVRFWNYVDKSQGPDACWPWTKSCDDLGYGFSNANRKIIRAHRHAWILTNGPIPEGMQVLHDCDNPPCCNPNHLWLGTDADNNADMISKGRARHPKGIDHPSAKLNDDAVRKIFDLREQGWTQKKIAANFGIYQTMVSNILLRKSWSHVEIPTKNTH